MFLALACRPALASGSDREVPLLDVPFVEQTQELCGGAALAMVLRYWGAADVAPERFAPLIEPELRGIRTTRLVAAAEELGFRTLAFRGDPSSTKDQLARGRPVILLLEVAPGRRHYVVVVAWGAGGALVHDPAFGPFRVVPEPRLLEQWERVDRWSLLVLPGEREDEAATEASADVAEAREAPAGMGPCDALLAEAVGDGRVGRLDLAELRLDAARRLCPDAAAPLRELAGVRFRQERWDEAAALASRSLEREVDDPLTWRLLATSRYLGGDDLAALAAWNRVGEPRLSLVRAEGLDRLPHAVITRRLKLTEDETLCAEAFERARRRLAALPGARATRLRLRTPERGDAEVEAVVLERRTWPRPAAWLVGLGADALAERRVRVELANLARAGETLNVSYRFWEKRPALSVTLAWPDFAGVPGVLRLEGLWERQSYAAGAGDDPLEEERRRFALSLADWSARAGVEIGLAVDAFPDFGTQMALSLGVERRLAADHVAVRTRAEGWVGGGPAFAQAQLSVAWRSSSDDEARRLTAAVEGVGVSNGAPFAVRPGAGTGHARPWLLRAHPLLDDGIVSGPAFGRWLLRGGIEGEVARRRLGPTRVALAAFADAARAWATPSGGAGDSHLDLGVGLRLGLPGHGRRLRLDYAVGVRDGSAFSVAWEEEWP